MPVDELPFYALLIIIFAVVLLGLYVWTRRSRRKAARPEGAKPQSSAHASTVAKTTAPPSEPPSASPPRTLSEHGIVVPIGGSSQPLPPPKPEEPAQTESPSSTPSVSPEPREHAAAEAPPSGLVIEAPEHTLESAEAAVSGAGTENAALVHARELFGQGHDCQAINELYDAAMTALASVGGVSLAPHMTYWEKYDAVETAVPEVQVPLRRLTLAYELCHYRDKPLTREDQDAALEAFRSIMQRVDERTQAK